MGPTSRPAPDRGRLPSCYDSMGEGFGYGIVDDDADDADDRAGGG